MLGFIEYRALWQPRTANNILPAVLDHEDVFIGSKFRSMLGFIRKCFGIIGENPELRIALQNSSS